MGNFVKRTTKTYIPSRVCSVAIDRIETDGSYALSSWSMHYYRTRTESDSVRYAKFTGTSGESLFDRLRMLSSNESRIYCVIEDGIDGLTLCGFFDELRLGRLSIRSHGTTASNAIQPTANKHKRYLPYVVNPSCDIVGALHESGSMRFVHPKNHGMRIDERSILTYATGLTLEQYESTGRPRWNDCTIDLRSRLILDYYRHVWQWWMIGDCGPWQDSIGALGQSWWKRHVPKRDVLIHDDVDAHHSECAAVFGGRQQVYFYGLQSTPSATKKFRGFVPKNPFNHRIVEPLYELDVRSMYVSLMCDNRFPVRLIGRDPETDPRKIYDAAKSVDYVVTCRVKLSKPSLPYRVGRHVHYPFGSWITTLTTPEFKRCYERGEIVEVIESYRYKTGKPFAEFARRALGLRWLAERVDDSIGASIFKSAANALGGKLARRESTWTDDDKLSAPCAYGEFMVIGKDPTTTTRARSIAGRVQIMKRSEKRVPGLTAAYAHLTAYGRIVADRILRAAGPLECVYWDTDGGLFTQSGVDEIRKSGFPFGDEPGQLRIKSVVQTSIHKSSKRYWRDGVFTLAGIPDGFTADGKGIVRYQRDVNPIRSALNPADHGLSSTSTSIRFDSLTSSSPVNSSGWLSSLSVDNGELSVSSTSATED